MEVADYKSNKGERGFSWFNCEMRKALHCKLKCCCNFRIYLYRSVLCINDWPKLLQSAKDNLRNYNVGYNKAGPIKREISEWILA
jgi:hypothetical protein